LVDVKQAFFQGTWIHPGSSNTGKRIFLQNCSQKHLLAKMFRGGLMFFLRETAFSGGTLTAGLSSVAL
jgi:hypothetical protein